MPFSLVSGTERPVTRATVRQLLTSGLPNLRAGGELGVEVDLVGVHRQRREPGVVGLRDRPADAAAVDVADLEILEEAPAPGLDGPVDELLPLRHTSLGAWGK